MTKAGINVRRALSEADRQIAFRIRHAVFVIGQGVPQEIESDQYEEEANHFICFLGKVPAGTARWRMVSEGHAKLERFAVLDEFRGMGVGRALVEAILEDIPFGTTAYLHAQLYVAEFYEKLGFQRDGEIFEEAGIQHVKMVINAWRREWELS